MSEARAGKLPPSQLARMLNGACGAESKSVIVGPGAGLDAAVLDLGDGRVMAVAEDPIFPAPGLPLEVFGEFTVHIGASDVAVTGIKPQFMTYTLLLPPNCPEADAASVIRSISETARALEIAIIGGHTGWYGAVTIPTVGGVTVWGFADKSKWVSPGGAREGDAILMTKGPAIEASALLAVLYRERLKDRLPAAMLDKLCARTKEISVVADALTAFESGGVHAMHDATEGGVLGGLWEMSAAAGLPVSVDLDKATVPEDIGALAKALEFDPWKAISEGTLLAAVEPGLVAPAQSALSARGIESQVIGSFGSRCGRSTIVRAGRASVLEEPVDDPFWPLFFAGLGG